MTARIVYYVGDEPMEEHCANCNTEVETDEPCPNGCDEEDQNENLRLASDPELAPSRYKQLLELEEENIYLALELNEIAKARFISYLDENPGPNYHPFEELTDEILMQRALAEDHLAQLELGHRASLIENSEDAAYWYLKGAQNGNIICAHNYACGVKNDQEAIYWFRKAAFKEYARSQHELGFIYQKKGDFNKSEIWFKLAFRHGILEACTDLGSLYWEQREIDAAVTYWRIAANLGDEEARKNLKLHKFDLTESPIDDDDELIKVTEDIERQSNLVNALAFQIKKQRSEILNGLFCTSNNEAFAIAEDVVSGTLTELKSSWVDSLDQAVQDILRISDSLEINGLDLSTVKSLDDLDLPISELLDWIASYDKMASDWGYSLEDMRRPGFQGIFCPDCDQEIGGESDCTNCASDED